jgi:hypothetical protein
MKKLKCLYILLLAALFYQCNDDDPEAFTLNQKLAIAQEDIIRLNIENDTGYIEIQVLNISDSRCPSDVTCVRFGEAEVKVAVNGLQEKATLVDLCIGDCPQYTAGFRDTDTVEVTLDHVLYEVILLDVIPFPTTTNQSDTKKACIKVITL